MSNPWNSHASTTVVVSGGYMPTRKVRGGYRYGSSGKIYKTKAQADRQGRAIEASKARRKKK